MQAKTALKNFTFLLFAHYCFFCYDPMTHTKELLGIVLHMFGEILTIILIKNAYSFST